MVLTAVASTMMSIEFLTPTPIDQYIQTALKAEHLALENLRKYKDYKIVTADKGVALAIVNSGYSM